MNLIDSNNLGGLNYSSLTNLRSAFQKSGGSSYDKQNNNQYKFNLTDNPGWNYFKILFDFNSPFLSLEHNDISELNPQTIQTKDNMINISSNDPSLMNGKHFQQVSRVSTAGEMNPNIVIKNTAYNYLLLNGEFERAELLKQFVQLLSNINTLSPWYFQEISGLGEALKRSEFLSNEFKLVGDEVKQITIKCLPDAIDARIGTLLDLYRAICFSQLTHRVIVPANLRKFDMSIYIFNTKIGYTRKRFNWSTFKYENNDSRGLHIDASFEQNNSGHSADSIKNLNDNIRRVYVASSKLIDLQNCEFDPDSNTSAYETLNNADGWQTEYNIGIRFDNAFEQRYNEHIQRFIGDMIAWDINYTLKAKDEQNDYGIDAPGEKLNTTSIQSELSKRLDLSTKYTIFNAIGGAITDVVDDVASKFLGNIFYTDFMSAMGSPEDFQNYALSKAGKYASQLTERGMNGVSELGTKAKGAIKQGAKNLWDDTVHHNKQERRQIRQQRREDRQRAKEYKNESKSSGIGTNLHKK